MTELFPASDIAAIQKFYQSYEPCRALDNYRGIAASIGSVKNLFFGDSITAAWPLHEFFPQYSVLNRGIGGDNPVGLYTRLEQDVFQYAPRRVFMLVGINGIQAPQELIVARICHVAKALRERGIAVYPSSILPLRSPDQWNRFQYQDKIVAINRELAAWSTAQGLVFLDYHSALKDAAGQLAERFARPDGTHLQFPAYIEMARIVKPHLES
ncbi:MAG: GDSL-type esterase/lipase family protein [Lentisphaeria bacterium]|nr:GDSL-type esterase/lipase family protein [Lentisphaeria bacterium]